MDSPPTPQTPVMEAVAHPVRLAIVRRLAGTDGASVADLAAASGAHANTARAHLAALERAGLVERVAEASRERGRPPLRYRLAGDRTLAGEGFRGIAELLAAAVARADPPPAELEALGHSWGRYLLGRPAGRADAATDVPRVLERLGFEADVAGDELRLSGCPCPLVSPDRPELVCGLADAVVEGVLEAAGGKCRMRDVVHDPQRRRCRSRLAA